MIYETFFIMNYYIVGIFVVEVSVLVFMPNTIINHYSKFLYTVHKILYTVHKILYIMIFSLHVGTEYSYFVVCLLNLNMYIRRSIILCLNSSY